MQMISAERQVSSQINIGSTAILGVLLESLRRSQLRRGREPINLLLLKALYKLASCPVTSIVPLCKVVGEPSTSCGCHARRMQSLGMFRALIGAQLST